MTKGDKMLARSIERALAMHPDANPLPVVIGGGIVKLSRPTAHALASQQEQLESKQRAAPTPLPTARALSARLGQLERELRAAPTALLASAGSRGE